MLPNFDSNAPKAEEQGLQGLVDQEPYSYDKIVKVADEFASDIRIKSKVFAEVVQSKWSEVKPLFTYNPETKMFEMPWDKMENLFLEKIFPSMRDVVNSNLRAQLTVELEKCRGGRSLVSGSLEELIQIIGHDVMHLPPRAWLFDSLYHFKILDESNNRIVRIPKDWMEYYDKAILDAEKLSNVIATVVDYSRGVLDNIFGYKVKEKPFKLADSLTNIGRIIKGRFSSLDFDLLINPSPDELTVFNRNRIVIIVDPELELKTSESFIFADIYNLVKNSAKAIEEKYSNELKLKNSFGANTFLNVLKYRLDGKETPTKPNQIVISANLSEDSVVLTVDDTGVGLSLDKAMSKVVEAMNVAIDIKRNLENSAWFNAMLALGLSEDAEMLIAWSKGDHNAIRAITIGTILSIQHLTGYEAEAWNLRSMTSGLGLLSVNYLAGVLGGKLLATNKFNGGAFFTLSLPKASVGL